MIFLIVQIVLCTTILVTIAVAIYLAPKMIFSFRHERMMNKMLDQLPCDTNEENTFFDIVEELCEDEAFLWRIHRQGKLSFEYSKGLGD